MVKKIWLSPPHLTGEEQKYIAQAFEENWIAPIGTHIDKFEAELAHYINTSKKVVALNSGTSAIHLALKLAGVKNGDVVICQDFTFAASVNPVLYLGGIPVFVDSEKDTWNMCPHLLEIAIQERLLNGEKLGAIVVVHSYGMPAKMKEICELGKKYKIPIIEDAASALGSKLEKKYCGTFGDFSVISFNGNKIITTSGGGILICNSEEQKEKAIFYASQAQEKAPHYQHAEIGYNYRLSNVLAGIGRGQLEVLNKRVQKRRANYLFYKNALQSLNGIDVLEEPNGMFSNRWLTCILATSFKNREKIRRALAAEHIESRPLWKPMHTQPIFKECSSYLNGVSEDLFARGLCLPSGSSLSIEDLERIIRIIKSCF
ncbi:aminotransferase class I/II-fold pyridoxal phosphate-dependent enzyme [Lutibacter sp. TH_r2]|uniref:DegT/DnrJ/EryC1/StrS family aminotransferase n=1 Tax=Lutibacter sp. TH_r2 TaxID=3082083 RepID=UPI002954B69A|nr:aminotransferase class I/II-fold pyridoxal phosphate-dependent enzyme [Lutibacter sp. TH_r2]MDV7187783.1 aminotransferase class I/II-fold pyridoxal phosphate-dependent enzyme [Lutibacter sp. TH_r2]